MTQNPSPPPTGTILQRLNAVLGGLLVDVSVRVAWGGISMALNVLIARLIEAHKGRIERIVTRLRAGTYAPRSRAPSRTARSPRPPRPPRLVQQRFGWLMELIPPYWQANNHRHQIEALLADPEMLALIAAAPAALGRPLRSLCWMLRIEPPPILAPPKRKPSQRTPPPPSIKPLPAPREAPILPPVPCRKPAPPPSRASRARKTA